MRQASHQRAVTLIELLAVLGVVAIMLGLLLPAVMSAREKAREAVCKNNLHQLSTALVHYAQAHKKLPEPPKPGVIGGWTVEVLPFLEESLLEESVPYGAAIADAPASLFRPPGIFRCPIREAIDEHDGTTIAPGHYVLRAGSSRKSFSLHDAPVAASVPWLIGPEVGLPVSQLVGPHHGGFFMARGFMQSIVFQPGRRN